MAFNGKGMKVVKAFSKDGQKGGFKQPQTKLVTVEQYNLSKASMIVVDDMGRKYEVTVEKKAIDRAVNKEKDRADQGPVANWSGSSIDSRMEKEIPVKSRVMLERSLPPTRQYKVGTDTVSVIECAWIRHATNPDPRKTFVGLLSVASYENKITSVQNWNDKALASDNKEAIEKISEELNQNSYAIVEKKEFRPGLGVQFRVIVPSTKEKEWVAIDTSPAFDWIPAEKDASGKVVVEGRPLDGDKFVELLGQYMNDYVAEKFVEYADKKVEILTYTNYFAAPKSIKMVLPEYEWHPFNKLANSETRLAMDDEGTVRGKNFAVNNGILELTDDGVDKVNKSFYRRDMVKALHADNLIGNVQSWVRTSDGQKCVPHEGLKVMKPKADNVSDDHSHQDHQAADVVSTASVSSDPFAENDPFASADPFATTSAPAPATAPISTAPKAEVQAETKAAAPVVKDEAKKANRRSY